MKVKHIYSQYFAEFLGTFFMVFFGCGSLIMAETMSNYPSSFIPLIWGVSVSIMIYALGHISGAHFNPAVTLAFWSIGKFPLKRVGGYLLSQFLGAILASTVHLIIWGADHSFGATTFTITLSSAILCEFLISFVLMFVIVSVATDARAVGELAGLAIGSTVMIAAFVIGPLTNASMNPARSLAPALLSGNLQGQWLYLLIPLAGAIAGAKVYEWIRCHKDESQSEFGCC